MSAKTPEVSGRKTSAMSPQFRELLNASRFDFFLDSKASEVHALVDALYSELKRARHITTNRHKKQRYRHLLAIALNLFSAQQISRKRYVSCPMGRNVYSKRDRYHARYSSHDMISALVSGLESLGHLERKPGWLDRAKGKGYETRLRATQSFRELFDAGGIKPWMVVRSPEFELIRLKDEDKNPVDYKDTEETIAMRARLEAINANLSEIFIGLRIPDTDLIQLNQRLSNQSIDGREDDAQRPINFTTPQLYRVFNDNSFELGGRFYGGWWQWVPSDLRKHIHVCHRGHTFPKQIIEIDYSSMQPSLVYAEVGLEPPEDAYRIPGASDTVQRQLRPVLKAAMLRMLNTKSPIAAAESLETFITEEGHTLPDGYSSALEIIRLMEGVHAPIQSRFYQNVGKRLMCLESRIAERVMEDMWLKGGVALPVHDSFLVISSYRWYLEESMLKAFEETTGMSCNVEFDETEAEYEHRRKKRSNNGDIEPTDMSRYLDSEYEAQERSTHRGFWDAFESWLGSREWHTPEPVSEECSPDPDEYPV